MGSDMQGQVIDVHSHIVPTRLAHNAAAGGLHYGIEFSRDDRGKITSSVGGKPPFALPWPTPLETPAERVGSMNDIGVDVHMLSLSPSLIWYTTPPADALRMAVETNDDIADVIAFLLSDDARYMTGQNVCVDGGFASSILGYVPGRPAKKN